VVIVQINLAEPQKIDFAPANMILEVAQNVYTLLATDKYTVPLDRNFGLSTTLIDQPINLVQAQLRAEILEAVAQYEPRFIVEEINFIKSTKLKEGVLYPTIKGRINDEYTIN